MSLRKYWRYRKQRKSYHRFRLITASYMIIFSVLLLKDVFQQVAAERFFDPIALVQHPLQAISFGWFSAIILQSASIVAVFINTLLGQELLDLHHAFYLMVGLILGNSATPLFVSLLVKAEKYWNIRHAFEIGFVNLVYSGLLSVVVLMIELATGIFTESGANLKHVLVGYPLIGYLPTLLNLVVAPLFYIFRVDQWPIIFSLTFSLVCMAWAFRLFGDSVIRYYHGTRRAQEKIKVHLGSKWKTFYIGLILSLMVPSASLLVSFLVPLAAKNIISLRQAIPYIIATNLATFIDVLVIAFANGSPGAITGAVMLMQISICGIIFMDEWIGISTIHKLTRFCTIRLIPQRKRAVALFLSIYTVVPLIIFAVLIFKYKAST